MEITPEGHAEGTLTARYDAASGELHYTYTLKQATQEHTVKGDKDSVEHDFTVTVIDTDGDEASSVIKIQIVDDVPVLTLEAGDAGEYGKPVMIGHLDARYGADGKAENSAISLKLDGKDAQHDGNGNYVVDVIGTISIAENGDIFFEPEYKSGGEASYSGITVSGALYEYVTDAAGEIFLAAKNPLELHYSKSSDKENDGDSVRQGLQDGLTVGDRDRGISEFEIGAERNGNVAEGIRFDLGENIAHSVTIKLGAFFCAGGSNSQGSIYDPIPERALLTFYDSTGKTVKQIVEHCLNEIGQCSNATLPAKARARISPGELASPARDILMRKML